MIQEIEKTIYQRPMELPQNLIRFGTSNQRTYSCGFTRFGTDAIFQALKRFGFVIKKLYKKTSAVPAVNNNHFRMAFPMVDFYFEILYGVTFFKDTKMKKK